MDTVRIRFMSVILGHFLYLPVAPPRRQAPWQYFGHVLGKAHNMKAAMPND